MLEEVVTKQWIGFMYWWQLQLSEWLLAVVVRWQSLQLWHGLGPVIKAGRGHDFRLVSYD